MIKVNKTSKLKQLFEKPGIIRLVGAHNAITAKLVEKNGFEGIWASGLEVSTSHAVPDANILTMRDFLEAAESMAKATSIPVILDGDTGYGNSNNVIHLVKECERRGIAGVCIEDKRFPKVNSYIPGRQELTPIAEFVGKILAAKNAQTDKDFMVFARVEALIAGWGQEEALKRAKQYAKAGADGIFIHSKKQNSEEIKQFVQAWNMDTPLIICPTSYPDLTIEQAKQHSKIKLMIFANHGIRASIKSINHILSKLNQTGDIKTIDEHIVPMKDVFELQGMFEMKENEKKYLVSENGNTQVIIPAAGKSNEPSLSNLLLDRPRIMLDINGKLIIQRIVETLNKSNIQDIKIITGYKSENVDLTNLQNITRIENPEYQDKGLLNSLMKGITTIKDKNLIIWSDILFEKNIIDRLLEKEEDIILVIDNSYATNTLRLKKQLDLVQAKYPPIVGDRVIIPNRENEIISIGRNINKPNFEFMGITLLSKKGLTQLKKEYEELNQNLSNEKFCEAENFDKADFPDMIQHMINKGYKINCLEINKGWMEVDDFEDYKKACELYN